MATDLNSAGVQDTKVSKFSITKERVLQKLGAHEKSKDQTFNESKERITMLEGYCTDISSVLNLWLIKVKELSAASIHLADTWLRVYEGTDTRMENVAHAYCKEQQNIQKKKIPMLEDKIQQFTGAIDIYRSSIDTIKEPMETRRKLQLSFDHYNSKFATLKANQEKNLAAGKLETLKQRERIQRNSQKLNRAKESFLKANHTVIKTLNHHWESRFRFFDDLFTQVVSNETKFFQAFTRTLGSTKPVLLAALKKPLPTPSEPPTKAEMNEFCDKWGFDKETYSPDKNDASKSGDCIPGQTVNSTQNSAKVDSLKHTKLDFAMGKAKSLLGQGKDLTPEPGAVQNNGFVKRAESISVILDIGLSPKQRKKAHPVPEAFSIDNSELSLDEIKMENDGRAEQIPSVIDPKDPFAMFDFSLPQNKGAAKGHNRACSTPIASATNPFSTSDKEKLNNSGGFDPWSIPQTAADTAVDDPFADVPEVGETSDILFGGNGRISENSTTFSSRPARKITPNPFAEEESEIDVRKGEPSPDPFAGLFM